VDVQGADAVLPSLHGPQGRRRRVVALPERGPHRGHPTDVVDRGWQAEVVVPPNRVRVLPDGMDRVERGVRGRVGIGVRVRGPAAVEAGRRVSTSSTGGGFDRDDARAAVIAGTVATGTLKEKLARFRLQKITNARFKRPSLSW